MAMNLDNSQHFTQLCHAIGNSEEMGVQNSFSQDFSDSSWIADHDFGGGNRIATSDIHCRHQKNYVQVHEHILFMTGCRAAIGIGRSARFSLWPTNTPEMLLVQVADWRAATKRNGKRC